jgi:AcrR family transcriptional regulator
MTKAQSKPPAAPRADLVRGEPIVQRVLAATVEELAQVGYRALRVEDVAARAGVNKTTVYRRWPEKNALVRDALGTIGSDKVVAPQTGSLRGDLLAMGRNIVELSSSPQGQSIVRMLVAEGSDPEVADLKRAQRCRHEAVPRGVVCDAIARGELPADIDPEVLFGTFVGAIHHRIFFMNAPVTEAFLVGIVDLILDGARAVPRGARAPAELPAVRPVAARPTPRGSRVRAG